MSRDVGQALLRDAVTASSASGESFGNAGSNWRSTCSPDTRANVVDSSVRALTRPRCSSISGRSSLEILRTSSSAHPDCLFGSVDLVAMCRYRFGDRVQVQQYSGQHLPYFVMKIASNSDPFGLLRCEDPAAALLRSLSSRSSMRLKARTTAPTSSSRRTSSRWPRRRRSTVPIRCASCSSGSDHPPEKQCVRGQRDREARDDDQGLLHLIGALIVTGVAISRIASTARRPPLTANTRQKSGVLRSMLRR